MTSATSIRLSFSFVSLSSLALLAPSSAAALACGEAAPRWAPEHAWPAPCETNVPLDGLVLVGGDPEDDTTPAPEGTLELTLQRVENGVPVESVPGKVTHPDGTSALFRSDRPLVANADYLITARVLSESGAPAATPFTSSFTTGSGSLAPVGFRSAPGVELEQFDKELQACTQDACGQESCTPTGETGNVRSLRIAVPALAGGVAQKPYALEANVTLGAPNGEAPVVATASAVAMQAGQRSFVVVDLPADVGAGEGCVTVRATDVAGHAVTSEPVCVAIPGASEGGIIPIGDEGFDRLESSASAQLERDESGAEVSDNAGGCAVAGGRAASGASMVWLALALTLARLRKRAPKA